MQPLEHVLDVSALDEPLIEFVPRMAADIRIGRVQLLQRGADYGPRLEKGLSLVTACCRPCSER